jgi:hypothetical protein
MTKVLRPAGLAVIAVAMAVALLVGAACGSYAGEADGSRGQWRFLPPPPAGRSGVPAVTVWTGQEVLLWGSQYITRDDGPLAYRPSTRSWRRLPRGPLPSLSAPVGAWTGTELLVWGQSQSDGTLVGALLNPRTGRWRTIAPYFDGARPGSLSAWTGDRLVVLTPTSYEPPTFFAAAYAPAADSWSVLTPPPPGQLSSATWDGREVLFLGDSSPMGTDSPACAGAAGECTTSTTPSPSGSLSGGLAYDPNHDSWRPVPPSPLGHQGVKVIGQMRGDVLVAAADTATGGFTPRAGGGGTDWIDDIPGSGDAVYDAAHDQWRRIASSPRRLSPGNEVVGVGGEAHLFVPMGQVETSNPAGASYDPAANRWITTPAPPVGIDGSGVLVGDRILVVGTVRDRSASFGGLEFCPASC